MPGGFRRLPEYGATSEAHVCVEGVWNRRKEDEEIPSDHGGQKDMEPELFSDVGHGQKDENKRNTSEKIHFFEKFLFSITTVYSLGK